MILEDSIVGKSIIILSVKRILFNNIFLKVKDANRQEF